MVDFWSEIYTHTQELTGHLCISWLHSDHLLTARAATDEHQTLIWRWHSDAFGIGEAESLVDESAQALTLNLRFPGQYYDQESGLHCNYFRTYNPAMGRYTQSDPIGLMGGVNTFAYASGNPLTMMDLLGLCDEANHIEKIYTSSKNISEAIRKIRNTTEGARILKEIESNPQIRKISIYEGGDDLGLTKPKVLTPRRSLLEILLGKEVDDIYVFEISINMSVDNPSLISVDGSRFIPTLDRIVAHELGHVYIFS